MYEWTRIKICNASIVYPVAQVRRERERTFFYKLMKNSILINIRSSYSIVASTRQAWRKFKKKIMNLKYKIFPVNKLLKNKKKRNKKWEWQTKRSTLIDDWLV